VIQVSQPVTFGFSSASRISSKHGAIHISKRSMLYPE